MLGQGLLHTRLTTYTFRATPARVLATFRFISRIFSAILTCRGGWRPFVLVLLAVAGPAQAASVLVLLSDTTGAYAEFADGIRAERTARGGYSVSVMARSEASQADFRNHDAVIAVGAGALRAVAQSDVAVPVLAVLVPQAAYESMVGAAGQRRWSAIFIDQPFSRQMGLIRLALPDARRVAVLLDSSQPDRLPVLRAAIAGTPLQLNSTSFSGEASLFQALSQVLDGSDVFLAMPDPQVHNASTVRNLLLTSFRARIPVVGFSAAYTRAGAAISLYSTPQQIARQATDALVFWLRERTWPAPSHPRHFTVSVNSHVARSLGLRIEEGDVLRDKLVRGERQP